MSKHASKPYNPAIANVYYLAGFIESGGRGIERICQACDEDGSPRPEYDIHPGDTMIKFTVAEDRIVHTSLDRVIEKVTEAEKEILSLLQVRYSGWMRSVRMSSFDLKVVISFFRLTYPFRAS